MRILVVNAFRRDNRGDAALLSVLLCQLAEAYPGALIEIAGFESPRQWPSFDGVPNLGSIRRYVGDEEVPRARRIGRKLLACALAGLAALPGSGWALRALAGILPTEIRAEVRALGAADLVLGVGGGHFNGRADLPSDLSIFFLVLPLWLARRFRVPVILAPQSFGPFPTRAQRLMVRHALASCHRVVARESISVHRLAEVGVPGTNVVRGVDSAFAFRGRSRRDWRTALAIGPATPLVLVTARQFLLSEAQHGYERAMATAITHLLDRGCAVVLAPQVTCAYQDDDDRIVNARIAALAADPRLRVLDDGELDHHEIFALYQAADFILGTRFHSVIFGLIAQVPCAAIEYDHKTRGIMADLSLEHWVLPMAEADPDALIALLDRLLAEGAGYRRYLAAEIPRYAARADDFVDLLRAELPPADPVSAGSPAQPQEALA
ncbi:colanic acid/amylovoran biosynthesis protein [Kitasatospora sp. GAS204A]|uniref:polysaccharide pyruvyl transferase family protein n=1 Tax=unclassified Kitasatospora TaxID=2633591 RepID=UPI002474D6B5|nr:polysaccharide pyruvyl transferase family protein [Kitasatospora sp. GAS204B]MDH6116443.1 colanic acid/amylovoran biosynthesis protein [Kitasatospora sp. GAS204B]